MLNRATLAWATPPVGLAVAIIVGVTVGVGAALIVAAVTIVLFAVQVVLGVKAGAKKFKNFANEVNQGFPGTPPSRPGF